MNNRINRCLVLLSLLLAVACASRQESSLQPSLASFATPSTTAASPTEPMLSNLDHITALVVQDLSLRLDIPESEIVLVDATPTEWENSALGCPFPGGNYPPGPVPGLLLNLESNGESYGYHADLTGRFVLCGPDGFPLLPVLPVTPGEIQDGSPWMPVDPHD